MPLTHDQIKERVVSLAKSIENQFEQEVYTDIKKLTAIAHSKRMELKHQILKELQSEYQVSYKEALFIAHHITKDRSSDDVFNIMKQHNLDEAALVLIQKLEVHYNLSLEDAVREASLIEHKDTLYKVSDVFYLIKYISSPSELNHESLSNIASILSKYNCNNVDVKLIFLLTSFHSLSLKDAAREASLIENKEMLLNSNNSMIFIKLLTSNPDSSYKSISEVANTLSKYKAITDDQILSLAKNRMDDISDGSITLDEALQNTVKFGSHGIFGFDIGLQPFSFIDYVNESIESVKEFFGFKNSSESIETPAQDLKAAELVDHSHNTDANE